MASIWESKRWPDLHWDTSALAGLLAHVSREQGRLLGRMESLGVDLRNEAHLRTLTEDVVKSSALAGEPLPSDQVRSSIARGLGLDIAGLVAADRHIDGVVAMMLDATGNYQQPLTEDRLFAWHAALSSIGAWRQDDSGPMQLPSARVPEETRRFLAWLENSGDIDSLLAAGLAHLWFVIIHPFDDGNARIACAIADMALARSDQSAQRFYSMSGQIHAEQNDYYQHLERAQQGNPDVTHWQIWFLECLLRAIEGAQGLLAAVLIKARFWERFAKAPLNDRQVKVLNRVLDGFEGKLTTSKWAKIAKCSQDTAHRDIKDLAERGALRQNPGGGRSTSYSIRIQIAS